MEIEPPFELKSLSGDNIIWSNRFEKATSGLYLPACQSFTAYGGWGNMSFQHYLVPEFMIWYSRYKSEKRSNFQARSSASLIEFSMQFDHSVTYKASPFEHQTIKNSQFNVFYLPYMESRATLETGQLTTTLDIHFSFDYLCKLSEYFPDILTPFLNRIEKKTPSLIFEKPLYATGFMLSVAGNILGHLKEQDPNPFFIELNVRSLISYALACKYSLSTKNKRITLEQITRIHQIRQQLETDLLNIPTLQQMAKASHMSVAAFKALFKSEIGDSPYHYWLTKKMEEMRSRILSSTDSISKIALDFGYFNVSNFSKKFKDKFGISPTDLRNKKD